MSIRNLRAALKFVAPPQDLIDRMEAISAKKKISVPAQEFLRTWKDFRRGIMRPDYQLLTMFDVYNYGPPPLAIVEYLRTLKGGSEAEAAYMQLWVRIRFGLPIEELSGLQEGVRDE